MATEAQGTDIKATAHQHQECFAFLREFSGTNRCKRRLSSRRNGRFGGR